MVVDRDGGVTGAASRGGSGAAACVVQYSQPMERECGHREEGGGWGGGGGGGEDGVGGAAWRAA